MARITLRAAAISSLLYQCVMAYFSPEWMLHHMLGFGSGFLMGGTALCLSVGGIMIGQALIAKSIQVTKSLFSKIKNRLKNNSKTNASTASTSPNTCREMIEYRGPTYVPQRAAPVISIPTHVTNPKSSFLTQCKLDFNYIVGNVFTRETVHWLATRFPKAGGLYEFTDLMTKSKQDDFFSAIDAREFDKVREMLKVIPSDSLHRMLARIPRRGYTTLLYVACRSESPDLLKDILEPLTHEQRLLQFQNYVVIEGKEGTFLEHLIDEYATFPNFKNIWSVIRNSLSHSEYFNLITKWDFKGESIMHYAALSEKGMNFKFMLDALTEDEIVKALTIGCKHALMPLINLFMFGDEKNITELMSLLPKAKWLEVMNAQVEGSNMKIGEKMLLASMINDMECSNPVDGAITKFLKRKYRMKLPEEYGSYSKNDLVVELKKLRELYDEGNCQAKYRFVERYGKTPEEILNLEPLTLPKMFSTAYRRSSLESHSDRNSSNVSNEKMVHLSAANAFLQKKDYEQYKNKK